MQGQGGPGVAKAARAGEILFAFYCFPEGSRAVFQHESIIFVDVFQNERSIPFLAYFEQCIVDEGLHAQGARDEIVRWGNKMIGDMLSLLF